MTRPAADQMVETLAAPGVEHFYGIVGDSLNGLTDALRRHGGFELSALIEALVQRRSALGVDRGGRARTDRARHAAGLRRGRAADRGRADRVSDVGVRALARRFLA
jgi:hypothetical protein